MGELRSGARVPGVSHAAAQAQPVYLLGAIVGDARRQHVVLPARRRQLEALELLDHRRQALGALDLVLAGDVLPMEQEAHEVGRADRLDLRAQAIERVAVDAREQAPVAPLELRCIGCEPPAQDASLGLERR